MFKKNQIFICNNVYHSFYSLISGDNLNTGLDWGENSNVKSMTKKDRYERLEFLLKNEIKRFRFEKV